MGSALIHRCIPGVVRRRLLEGPARDEADQLAASNRRAVLGGEPPYQLDDAVDRRRFEVRDIKGNLSNIRSAQEADGSQGDEPAAALPQRLGNRPGDADVRAGQVDVERDQKRTRADGDDARGSVGEVTDVGGFGGLAQPFTQSFEFAATDVREQPAPRDGGRGCIEVRRHLMPLPNKRRRLARQRDRVSEPGAAKRNERQHVERADPGMRSAVDAQIDMLGRYGRKVHCSLEDVRRRADRGDHAAMMRGIARAMDDPRAAARDGCDAGVDDRFVTSLGDVRYDLEQSRHGPR